MRDKIAKLYIDNCFAKSLLVVGNEAEEFADQILSLINAERCVWTRDEDGDWDTECGRCYDHDEVNMPAGYCNGCGKQIEVKDANKT
jgi:rRNA maturation endonuclease Nob1